MGVQERDAGGRRISSCAFTDCQDLENSGSYKDSQRWTYIHECINHKLAMPEQYHLALICSTYWDYEKVLKRHLVLDEWTNPTV